MVETSLFEGSPILGQTLCETGCPTSPRRLHCARSAPGGAGSERLVFVQGPEKGNVLM